MTKQPAISQPGVSIETDSAKNEKADEIIDILVTGPFHSDPLLSAEDKVEYGVLKSFVQFAGKALANRFCFAMSYSFDPYEEDQLLTITITPLSYFKEYGSCDELNGRIIQNLVPKHCYNESEATWTFSNLDIKPIEAAKELQQAGFFWSRDFQNYIDASMTKELSVLEQPQPAVKTNIPLHPGKRPGHSI